MVITMVETAAMAKTEIVSNWMTREVITVQTSTHLHDARRLMTQAKIRVLPILEFGKLVGIITKRDLLRFDPSTVMREVWSQYRMMSEQTVGSVMTENVTTIEETATIPQAARAMLENKISALPVIHNGQIAGMITGSDLFRFIITEQEQNEEDWCTKDYMTTNPKTVTPKTTLLEAHRIMGTQRIRALPVVREGVLVGIATRSDLLSADPSIFFSAGNSEISKRIQKAPIEYIMTSNPISVCPTTPISEVAKLMLKYKIHSLPVLENGELTGIITESDLYRLIVQKYF